VHVEYRVCHDAGEAESLLERDDRPFHSGDLAVAWTDPAIQSFWVIAELPAEFRAPAQDPAQARIPVPGQLPDVPGGGVSANCFAAYGSWVGF
jgi:hypothetical protein